MKADTITKDFISDTSVFADIFNYYIYGGEAVIAPEQLEERDTAEISIPYGTDEVVVPVQRFRDKQNLCTIMTDGALEYVLFGAEAQAEIQYAMPVKNNLYDALDYAGQVEKAAKSHRRAMRQEQKEKEPEKKASAKGQKEKEAEKEASAERQKEKEAEKEASAKRQKEPNRGEFLSGFWKEDRLIPSVTVTIYFGCQEWDGPLSLFDMLEVKDQRVLSCLDNHRIHLIAPARMEESEIMKFRSNLREVLLFIKYSKDKEKLNRILESGKERFRELERRAADVIEVITGMGLEFEESEVKVDMCQAIAEMRAEERQIGREEGRQEMSSAIAEMRAEERQIGREEGRREMSSAIAEMRAEERQIGREEGRREMSSAIAEMRTEERQIGREEGRQEMSSAIAEMRAEERQIGREEGRQKISQAMQESQQKAARNFYRMGLDIETISLGLNLSSEIVRQWVGQPSDDVK